MKKYFYVALVALASATMFVACDPNKPSSDSKQGEWLTTPDQIANYNPTDTTSHCYQVDLWCDGTTIGREYMWAPESAVLLMIKMSMDADYKAHGQYTKKYQYVEVTEPTEESCNSRVWEGAKCWLITYTMPSPEGGTVTDQEYFWAPEENARERWEYYKAHLSEVGLVDYAYEATDINDEDACYAMNPSDTTVVTPPDPEQKDYSQYDSLTYRCWMVTQTSYGMNIITYVWMTERQVNEYYDQMKFPYVYEPADANDADACMELNDSKPGEGEEACWKITVTFMGQSETEYLWGTESNAQETVNYVNQSGLGTATYEKTSVGDADSCNAMND